jgi:hypothetical protein
MRDRRFLSTRIPEAKKAKRPDFEIARPPRALTYLGELKAPELHLNKDTNLYMHLTKIRKLREHTQKAVEQFKAIDPNHEKPRILIFVSTHFQLHSISLLEALRGFIVRNDGTIETDFRSDEKVRNTATYIRQVDLYIWLQISSESHAAYQASYIVNNRSAFPGEVRSIVDELSKTPVSSMDRHFEI